MAGHPSDRAARRSGREGARRPQFAQVAHAWSATSCAVAAHLNCTEHFGNCAAAAKAIAPNTLRGRRRFLRKPTRGPFITRVGPMSSRASRPCGFSPSPPRPYQQPYRNTDTAWPGSEIRECTWRIDMLAPPGKQARGRLPRIRLGFVLSDRLARSYGRCRSRLDASVCTRVVTTPQRWPPPVTRRWRQRVLPDGNRRWVAEG